MSDKGNIEAVNAIKKLNEQGSDVIMKRIGIKSSTINKMKKVASLFNDEMGDDLKEAEMIAFFFEKSFDAFLKSGEIENRIKSLTE
jgi:hypothetical protein